MSEVRVPDPQMFVNEHDVAMLRVWSMPAKLDVEGRCCGRKPMVYKRPYRQFCPRCDREFSVLGKQQTNWRYKSTMNGALFVREDPVANPAVSAKRTEGKE